MMTEHWKPVVGFNGYYEVSDCGRVRSVGRVVVRNNRRTYPVKPKVLKPIWIGPAKPYLAVALCRDGKRKIGKLHRLVAEAFLGPAPEGKALVLHGDGDCTNNRLSNLRWGTQAENMTDSMSHGSRKRGSKRLTLEQFIGCAYGGHTLKQAAEIYQVHPVHISKIRNNHASFPKVRELGK